MSDPWKNPVPVKKWQDRANTIGYISGGLAIQAALLRQVLERLPAKNKDIIYLTSQKGEEVAVECENLCVHQLSTTELVERDGHGGWRASVASQQWLQNADGFFLAAHIHARVKFFGELLEAVDSDTTHAHLLAVACDPYGLSWNSDDQVRRRVAWLRSLGFLELWKSRIVRTELGDRLLGGLDVCSPDDAAGAFFEVPAVRDTNLMGRVEAILANGPEGIRNKKSLIGYIPRVDKEAEQDQTDGKMTPIGALRKIYDLVGDGVSVDVLRDKCEAAFGISRTSFSSMLNSVRHLGVIEQTGLDEYATISDMEVLLKPGEEPTFVAHLHSRYLFVGEILRHLDEPSTAARLTQIAKNEYGYNQITAGEVRVRLQFLQDAQLIHRIDWQRFRSTALGKQFSQLLPAVEMLPTETVSHNPSDSLSSDVETALPRRLKDYGGSGTNSKEFEIAVAEAFQVLGFRAEHLGGSGRTDVLATAELTPSDTFQVIVDAKSSGGGVITDSHVKFDALKDHKKKHHADHVVVVGPDFSDRVKQWAVERGFALFTVRALTEMLERHRVTPLGLREIGEILTRADLHEEEAADKYSSLEQQRDLLIRILQLAFQEATDEDPISEGYISIENLTYVLRKEISPRPTMNSIKDALDFLSGPLVGALEESKGRYKILDSPTNVGIRLSGLGAGLGLAGRGPVKGSKDV